eukprot:1146916-Pelagomonas_calceolata.AAC.5
MGIAAQLQGEHSGIVLMHRKWLHIKAACHLLLNAFSNHDVHTAAHPTSFVHMLQSCAWLRSMPHLQLVFFTLAWQSRVLTAGSFEQTCQRNVTALLHDAISRLS